MSFIVENKVFWRRIVLALFILSLLGPWMYDRLNVPAEYSCGKPSFRLEGDFCGYPMSGFHALAWSIGGFFYMVVDLIQGDFFGQTRELLVGLFLFPILPFFSTLLLIWKKDSHRLQIINLFAWGLGCILPLLILILEWNLQTIHLWGLWLYIVLAISALIFETSTLRSNAKNATN